MKSLYYRVEQALLRDYFGLPRPAHLAGVDILQPDRHAPRKAVRVEPDSSGSTDGEWALPNAVARIALSRIQGRLPQWYRGDGRNGVFGRTLRERGDTGLLLMPLHLFTLNWADSGPGFSWPEAYHVTFFPGFERHVVTASADSPDTWGYEDRAIGWFGPDLAPVEGARSIVTGFWRDQVNDRNQGRWAYLFDEGAVSDEEANAWADAVWAPETVGEED
ncbi:MAG: hypothetical protein MUC79_15030 [Thiobacillaceae bacterium]|jgi:hypothetical protein|nr:hypothetical protein [Thiobacillaceae bacterium]